MATVYETSQKYRRDLLRGERQSSQRLTVAYSKALRQINDELVAVRRRIQEEIDKGTAREQIASLLFREGRLQALDGKVRDEIARFARGADIIVGGAIDTARELGEEAAGTLIDIALPEGITVSPTAPPDSPLQPVLAQTVNVPAGAVERVVPAATLLDGLAPAAAQAVGDALAAGLAQGKNPRVVARMMRDALGGNLTRALTIARTETLRAYREASREVYVNSPYVREQRWVSALDDRSCAACIALHGTTFPLTEPMASHPNCRCTAAPVTPTPRELGLGNIPDTQSMETGVSWFRAQDDDTQRRILGPSRYALYRARKVTLPDLVQRRQSPVWGESSQVASIAQAEANAAARRAS